MGLTEIEAKMSYTYASEFEGRWNFVAMEYYLGILNRTFQVFVSEDAVAGAKVRGLAAAPLLRKKYWFVPEAHANKRLLAKYSQVQNGNVELPRGSLANFIYKRADIKDAWFDPTIKWGMGTFPHSGKLYIKLSSGKTRELILVGLQQGEEIAAQLARKPNRNTKSKENVQVHKLMEKVYALPSDKKTWQQLAELLSKRGERAQMAYIRGVL
jgi:hypothetical protein